MVLHGKSQGPGSISISTNSDSIYQNYSKHIAQVDSLLTQADKLLEGI